MFWSVVERVRKDLEDLQSVVSANERLKALVFSPKPVGNFGNITEELRSIEQTSPARSVWALYDHCAAVTRLYAIFEDFVDSIVKEYLEALPSIFPNYVDLPPSVLNQHRHGVAQILSKLGDKGLYRHLSERDTLVGITDGYLGRGYSLLADAFLTDTQNYRADQINITFGYLNISDIWAGVEKHSELLNYMKSRDPNETARTIINKLIQDRNFAAHSVVTDVLSGPELISLAQFLIAIAISLSEIARKSCVTLQCSVGKRLEMFRVLHRFSNKIVGVKFLQGRVNVGDQLLVLGRDGAYRASVISIRRLDLPLESADAEKYPELGLGLDVEVENGARMISFHTTAAPLPLAPLPLIVTGPAPEKAKTIGRFRRLISLLREALEILLGRR